MEKIKFRAWDKQLKVWVEDIYIGNDGWFFQNSLNDHNPNIEIQLFTGFLDKNREEIYRGDFLKGDDNKKEEVVWSNERGQWMIRNNENPDDNLNFFAPCCEVIGNVFENPELLS